MVSKITNIKEHLLERGVDFSRTPVILDEVNNYAVFLLYNLSGQLVGYQNYNPNADKTYNQCCSKGKHITTKEMIALMRYFTYTTKIGKINQQAVWGLETLSPFDNKIFLTEGIFDIIKIHNQNLPGLAIMGNDPKHLKGWLDILPCKKIVIYDDDLGGRKLAKYGTKAYTVPDQFKDLGEMQNTEVKDFLEILSSC